MDDDERAEQIVKAHARMQRHVPDRHTPWLCHDCCGEHPCALRTEALRTLVNFGEIVLAAGSLA